MRVLFLNQYALPSGEAGITRHGDIGAELVRRGHDVTVIASDFDYFTRTRTKRRGRGAVTNHDGVIFKWLPTGTYVANDRRRVASMVRYAMLAWWAGVRERPAPDVIVGSSPQPLAPLAADGIARVIRRPWIFEARDIWPSALVELNAIKRNGTTHRLLERLERYSYVNSDAVVTVPPMGWRRLEELGIDPQKCMHIPNGATTLMSQPGDLPDTLERLIGDHEGAFILVYAGAVGVPHGFESVVAAVKLLRNTQRALYERLLLLIVGDGVAADPLRRAAASHGLNRLQLHPAIPKSAVRTLLARADACLMQAAASEHFKYGFSPNKLFDYFAAGKPVLISSAHPTLVDETRAGLRFSPGDPESLAQAIGEMMNISRVERSAMGERGRMLVPDGYSIPAITDRYEAVLARVADTGSPVKSRRVRPI